MREVRRGTADDLPALTEIFWRGVHEGAAPKYSAAQRQAWLPERPVPEAYGARIAGQTVFVAEVDGVPSGYMTLRGDGYLDFAYVLPEMRGTGLADLLLAMVENHARASGLSRLTTRASDMARPFFARHGWHVVAAAQQVRGDVVLPSTDMAKDLVIGRAAVA